jgi:hypothetical protein
MGCNPQADPHLGRFQEFVIEGLLQFPDQGFAGLEVLHQLLDLAVAPGGLGVAAAVLEIPPGMVRDRLNQPRNLRDGSYVNAQLLGELQQDVLGHVLGVGIL